MGTKRLNWMSCLSLSLSLYFLPISITLIKFMPAFVTLTNLANKDFCVFSLLNHMKISESLL